MDSLIAAAARALATGDMLGALQRVSLRDDAPALALRGIAMAQLGEHALARDLLRRAARAFGPHEALASARCVVAEAEVALAMRELGGSTRALLAATEALEARADRANALHARLIHVRRLLLLGRLHEAAGALARVGGQVLPPPLAAVAEMAAAELALRSLRTGDARAALDRAARAAERSGVPALRAEVADARSTLEQPAARQVDARGERVLMLDDVAALRASGRLVIDACRHGLGAGERWVALARRPLLFTLARTLGEAGAAGTSRARLIGRAFRTEVFDDSHRARLRVEIGRLRALLRGLATIDATPDGFVLRPLDGPEAAVIVPPVDGDGASLVALLSDGAAWSTSALALASGDSQRAVQRALADLEAVGRVRTIGQGRSRRWLALPFAGFTTILLLPQSLPAG